MQVGQSFEFDFLTRSSCQESRCQTYIPTYLTTTITGTRQNLYLGTSPMYQQICSKEPPPPPGSTIVSSNSSVKLLSLKLSFVALVSFQSSAHILLTQLFSKCKIGIVQNKRIIVVQCKSAHTICFFFTEPSQASFWLIFVQIKDNVFENCLQGVGKMFGYLIV